MAQIWFEKEFHRLSLFLSYYALLSLRFRALYTGSLIFKLFSELSARKLASYLIASIHLPAAEAPQKTLRFPDFPYTVDITP